MYKSYIILVLLLLSPVGLLASRSENHGQSKAVAFCSGKKTCSGHDSDLTNIRVLQQEGARPSWSPDGKQIVFDRQNSDGYSDVYLMDSNGKIVRSLTDGRSGIGQENNGNAVFAPSGRYIVFISEVPNHYLNGLKYLADPGLGSFCNLWATDASGAHFWQLTNIQFKQSPIDPTPVQAIVNPRFSPDGKHLYWTERYDGGGDLNWGKWRIMRGDFIAGNTGVSLSNITTVYVPSKGNYVTAMGVVSSTQQLLLAGNLDGQPVYGMDQYLYDPKSKSLVNLQKSPSLWEEGAAITPHGHIIYMTNAGAEESNSFQQRRLVPSSARTRILYDGYQRAAQTELTISMTRMRPNTWGSMSSSPRSASTPTVHPQLEPWESTLARPTRIELRSQDRPGHVQACRVVRACV